MKRISVLAWTGILALVISLTGISCSREQAKEKAPGKAPEHAVLPPMKETPPGQTMPPEQGEIAEKPIKDIEKTGKGVIARVNDTDITTDDLTREMNQIGPLFIKEKSQRTPENVKKVRDTAIDILIFRELAVQEAVKQGLNVRLDVVAETKKQLKANLGSEEAYRNYLKKMGLTDTSLNKMLEKELLFQMITKKEIFEKAKPNDKVSIENRKKQWESGLKKNAKIEVLLPEGKKELQTSKNKK